MKRKTGLRILSLLLTLSMILPMFNLAALAEEIAPTQDTPPEALSSLDKAKLLRELGLALDALDAGNTDQSDDMYLVNGRPHKVIYNDYIACYVSADDGRYAVLPAGVPLEEDAPTGSAIFTIDGADYIYGESYPEQNSTLLLPRVAQDMVITEWTIGDYVISQYHAIVEDAGHEDSYAVKVAYAAEYFGQGESEISARLILPARLGEETEDALLLTDANQTLPGPGC